MRHRAYIGRRSQIDSVEPVRRVGDVRDLPVLVLTTSTGEDLIISREGYPAAVASGSTLTPVAQADFTHRCGDDLPVQQILIGLEAHDDQGGGWQGARITYHVGDDEYVLEVPVGMLMCGEATEPCGDA